MRPISFSHTTSRPVAFGTFAKDPDVWARRRTIEKLYDKKLTAKQNLEILSQTIFGLTLPVLNRDLYEIRHQFRSKKIKKARRLANATQMERRLARVEKIFDPALRDKVMARALRINTSLFRKALEIIRSRPGHPKKFDVIRKKSHRKKGHKRPVTLPFIRRRSA